MFRPVAALTLLLAALAPGQVAAREWASASGQHKTEAQLREVKGGEVWLERPGEKPFPVKLDQLGKEDRDYVMSLATLGREFDAADPVVPPEVAKLAVAAEQLREPELARREVRIESLRESLRVARKAKASAVIKQLSGELKDQIARVRHIEHAVLFVPQISPEGTPGAKWHQDGFPDGFRHGQIGALDEGFAYNCRRNEDGTVYVSSSRRHTSFGGIFGVSKNTTPTLINHTESAPYKTFYVTGLPLDAAKPAAQEGIAKARRQPLALSLALRRHVFVVEAQTPPDPLRPLLPRTKFVLSPVDMGPINAWLKLPLVIPTGPVHKSTAAGGCRSTGICRDESPSPSTVGA